MYYPRKTEQLNQLSFLLKMPPLKKVVVLKRKYNFKHFLEIVEWIFKREKPFWLWNFVCIRKLVSEKFHPFIFPLYWDIYMTVVDAYRNWLLLTDSFSLNPGFKVIDEVIKISGIMY